jgi:hypothetical protein
MSLLACTTILQFNLLASSLSLLPAYYGQVCLHTEGPTSTGCLNSAERFTVARCWRDSNLLFPGKGIPLLISWFRGQALNQVPFASATTSSVRILVRAPALVDSLTVRFLPSHHTATEDTAEVSNRKGSTCKRREI